MGQDYLGCPTLGPNCPSHPDDNPPLKAIMFLIGFICYDDACHLNLKGLLEIQCKLALLIKASS